MALSFTPRQQGDSDVANHRPLTYPDHRLLLQEVAHRAAYASSGWLLMLICVVAFRASSGELRRGAGRRDGDGL